MSPAVSSSASSSEISSQDSLSSQYELENHIDAIASYARKMHTHTKRQMDLATRSSTRRSEPKSSGPVSTFSPESSVDSNAT